MRRIQFPVLLCKNSTLVVVRRDFFDRVGRLDEAAGKLELSVAPDGRAGLQWILDCEGTFFRLTSQGFAPANLLQKMAILRSAGTVTNEEVMIWFSVLGILIFSIYFVILFRRQGRGAEKNLIARSEELEQLTLDQVQSRVEDIFSQGSRFFVEPAHSVSAASSDLGPIAGKFFSKYKTIRSRNGGFQLSLNDIKPSEYLSGFLSIGHSEDWDIVLRRNDDQIFVVEGSEVRPSEMEVHFPSIYHLILDEADAKND